MMKKRNKITVSLMFALALIVVLTGSAFAASQYVYLDTNETSDVSSSVSGITSHAWGYNFDTSAREVYLILDVSYGSGWSEVEKVSMRIGNTKSTGTWNSNNSQSALWRTELNPVGWLTKGCKANGYVYNN